MVILHICRARAIFLIFFYHQDTESKSCEMEINNTNQYSPINRYRRLYGRTIYIHQNRGE